MSMKPFRFPFRKRLASKDIPAKHPRNGGQGQIGPKTRPWHWWQLQVLLPRSAGPIGGNDRPTVVFQRPIPIHPRVKMGISQNDWAPGEPQPSAALYPAQAG